MLEFFLKIIGVGESITSKLEHAELHWSRYQLLIIGLILLAPAAWFITTRHKKNLPHITSGPRRALSVCRVAVLMLLVIVLGGPYVSVDEKLEQRSVVAFVVDESASMHLPAGPFKGERLEWVGKRTGVLPESYRREKGDPPLSPSTRERINKFTRLNLIDKLIEVEQKRMLPNLGDRFDVRFYRVAADVRRLKADDEDEKDESSVENEVKINDQSTSLGAALDRIVEDAAGQPIAGIVLLSDGRSNAGPNPMEIVRRHQGSRIARGPDAKSIAPIFAIPAGSEIAALDIELIDVLAPNQLAKNDTATIVATVGSRGFNDQTVKITLVKKGESIDEQTVKLADGQRQQVQLRFKAESIGAQMLNVHVQPLDEEQIHDNNDDTVVINVDSDKQKVLYLEGNPRWDFRFLDHALRRDSGLETTIVMESQLIADGTTTEQLPIVAKLPVDSEGWAEYKLVILGDISMDMLPWKYQEQLIKAIDENGVGLVVQAGPSHMPHVFANRPLIDALPVKPRRNTKPNEDNLSGLFAPAFKPFNMRITATGSIHSAFSLYQNAQKNRGVWSRMPGFYWCADITELKPGATMLADVETTLGKIPLIAEHHYGKGRVLFIGTDSTYRWRRNIGSHFFYRFWGQAVRHVARGKQRGGDESWIEVHPKNVALDEPVIVKLYAVDADKKALTVPQVNVRITHGEDVEEIQLAKTDQDGQYRGQWQSEIPGQFTFIYDAAKEPIKADVQVMGTSRELRRPIVDRDALGTLADASGGELIEIEQLDELPQRLKGETATIERHHEATIWDNWLTMLLLVGFYCTDVGIRRLMGLL